MTYSSSTCILIDLYDTCILDGRGLKAPAASAETAEEAPAKEAEAEAPKEAEAAPATEEPAAAAPAAAE